MNNIAKDFGARVKFYRYKLGISQDKLSELCELHPTYIGQLERGEKNASLETIMRLSKGLEIPPALLFERLEIQPEQSTAQQAYDLFMSLPPEKQHTMLDLLKKAAELL